MMLCVGESSGYVLSHERASCLFLQNGVKASASVVGAEM